MRKFRIIYTVLLNENVEAFFSEHSEEIIYDIYANDKDEALQKFYHKHSKKYHEAFVFQVYNEETGEWKSVRRKRPVQIVLQRVIMDFSFK